MVISTNTVYYYSDSDTWRDIQKRNQFPNRKSNHDLSISPELHLTLNLGTFVKDRPFCLVHMTSSLTEFLCFSKNQG